MSIDGVLEKKYGVVIFVALGVMTIPQLYYLSNLEEFGGDYLLPLLPLLVGLALLVTGILLPLGQYLQSLLAGIGLSVLLCDLFLRTEIRPLDGSSTEIAVDEYAFAINVIVYVGLPLVLLLASRRLKPLLVNLALFSVLLSVLITAYAFLSTLLYHSGQDRSVSTSFASNADGDRPNVYFLWLDAMQTDYFEKYVSSSAVREDFRGFTLFENNSANYLYSNHSYVSFMSGTIYKGGSYEEWRKGNVKFRQDLKDLGYRTTTYVKKDFVSPLDDIVITDEALHSKWTGSTHPQVSDYITYWLVRSVPSVLATKTQSIGKAFGDLIHAWFNPVGMYANVKTIADGIEPLKGVFVLKQLVMDEEDRDDMKELVIAHALIPHGPYVLDKECIYRGPTKGAKNEAFYEQVVCSVDLVRGFFRKLKDLGRYDSSLIIVMGDHGSGWAGLSTGDGGSGQALRAEYMPWSKSQVLSRASALLMIKPPNMQDVGPLRVSSKESQLVDIYPTTLALLGFSDRIHDRIDGIDLFADTIVRRNKFFTYFKPASVLDPFMAEIFDLIVSPSGGLSDLRSRGPLLGMDDLSEISCQEGRVDFNKSDRSFLATGMGAPESFGRWSIGKRTTISFKLPKSGCAPSRIALHLNAFVTNKNKEQSATVLLNGRQIGAILFRIGERPRDFVFDLPDQTVKPGEVNVLEFLIANPVTPKSVGINEDGRELGLGFVTMTLLEE